MLARGNRLVTGHDFRVTLRRGRAVSGTHTVTHVAVTAEPARFGFIVAKKVGNAVTRNRVRRRLRAIARELVDTGFTGADVVVRPRTSSADAGFVELRGELRQAVGCP